jgi:ectoine hydroxylase-related dioxygenase (phytanoyl-CoA dioxygenase family)
MSRLSRLPRSATTEDVITILERDGGVIIENFLEHSLLTGLQQDLLPRIAERSTGRDSFSGGMTKRLGALFAHTRHCAPVVTDPLFLPVAEHFLIHPHEVWAGDERHAFTPDVRIGATQAIQIGPGETAQPLHRDDTAFMWRHPTNGREGRLQIMLALSDFTAENGATLTVPGSHLWDDQTKPDSASAVPAEMKAGSALLWLGSLFHAGGANRTLDQTRTGVTIAIDVSTVRQEENMYLALDKAVVASYPEQIQRLLGWSAGTNLMGWVEVDGQMTDPNHLLGRFDPLRARDVTGQR